MNPATFRSGEFVAEHVDRVTDEQVQPNGVDLTLDAVYEPVGVGFVGCDAKNVAEREEVQPDDGNTVVGLGAGCWVVQYGERLQIPEGHVGFVLPRSTLLRNGATLETAVWDAGYEGRGEGLLQVHHGIAIQRDARIGQLVLARANHEEEYDGSYQGERLDGGDSR